MDYEKAYKEALERARKIKNGEGDWRYSDLIEIGPALTEIFPELRESEDERMRKAILAAIRQGLDTEKALAKYNVTYDDVEAWLEKQKEPKPELVQQPPITYTYNSNASRDERLKAALLALLNSDLLKVKEGGYFTKQDLIEWVERIPTDKPAWSEEDEKIIANLRSTLANISVRGLIKKETEQKYSAWLKSLRPGWKPTEEQMNALQNAVLTTCDKELVRLYNQLKKL